ncbi:MULTISPECIES: hypothetical protein [Pseudomonas]|uniref:hypothetical protein n=1 Tax=Pseudomonas TaxID=286 RepID=UPI0008B835FE|nr:MULTISPECIES: hypothetical protein [Pseudomonas]PMV20878.1 hypothetical protein C1X17_18790 [Pseudomonas sp. FW305-3-2-15-C-TSA2]PMV26217.1 hypothetical protein C1X22_19175 [Pseudomonas sp. DP16D-L5]PMV37352.1 hypothetical protein C1X21_19970 [Pseudomonas sp. FW305-3-2-15-A-LB2]PMV43386.1 hypothetical protein C1X16_20885 [Pseudomonas sp. FW305-3-2-15-C-R2A1]PMV50078.1 hypothetical protein C1X18_17990 [Pseudomonas sp. FW305-3-2-15-C-LB1]
MKRIALLSLALALGACQSNQRDSSSSLFKDGIQFRQKTVAVDAEHAKVIMKSSGGTPAVDFSISREGDPDSRMEALGTVMDTGEGKVFNWIAKLNQTVASAGFKRFPQLEIQADPGKKLTVSGYANDTRTGYYYTCGPEMNTFSPEKAKVYLVEFQFKGSGCEQHVYDVTDPANRVPVAEAGSGGKSG